MTRRRTPALAILGMGFVVAGFIASPLWLWLLLGCAILSVQAFRDVQK